MRSSVARHWPTWRVSSDRRRFRPMLLPQRAVDRRHSNLKMNILSPLLPEGKTMNSTDIREIVVAFIDVDDRVDHVLIGHFMNLHSSIATSRGTVQCRRKSNTWQETFVIACFVQFLDVRSSSSAKENYSSTHFTDLFVIGGNDDEITSTESNHDVSIAEPEKSASEGMRRLASLPLIINDIAVFVLEIQGEQLTGTGCSRVAGRIAHRPQAEMFLADNGTDLEEDRLVEGESKGGSVDHSRCFLRTFLVCLVSFRTISNFSAHHSYRIVAGQSLSMTSRRSDYHQHRSQGDCLCSMPSSWCVQNVDRATALSYDDQWVKRRRTVGHTS